MSIRPFWFYYFFHGYTMVYTLHIWVRIKRRKEKIRSIIESRFPPTHQTIQTVSQRQPESEGKEDTQMKEESKENKKGYLPVNLHFKKKIPLNFFLRYKTKNKKPCSRVRGNHFL